MAGVKIKLYTGDINRITKVSGCNQAISTENYQFEENSYIPNLPWQKINNETFNLLSSNKKNYTDVSLISLPNEINKALKNFNIHNCSNFNDVRIIENTQSFKNLKIELISYFKSFTKNNSDIIAHNIYYGKENLLNNTFNFATQKFIGFHLDSWEGQPLWEREFSNNRICINLGKESRFLMFYNISIIEMANALNISIYDADLDINSIYKKYITLYPDTPIYRLEILPLEAYIAPTEFIIHDGSSYGTKSPDINIVFRGSFYYKPKRNIITNFFNWFK